MVKKKKLPGNIVGSVDHVSSQEVRGWAFWQAKHATPVYLNIKIDGQLLPQVCADIDREDVQVAGLGKSNVGFRIPVPAQFRDGRTHLIEFFDSSENPLVLWQASAAENSSRCEIRFESDPGVSIMGNVDGLQDGAIRGWAVAHDQAKNRMSGGLQILVTMHGQPVAQLTAAQMRVDVAEALGCDPNCGFAFVPPPEYFAGKVIELAFKVIPGSVQLPNSPYLAAFPDYDTSKKIRSLSEEADKIFVQLWQLRAQIRGLLPAPQFTLQSYQAWFDGYARKLAKKTFGRTSGWIKGSPLVSIVCPVYKPRIQDLSAAVESVLAQTYKNIELILVDDASDSPALSALIATFAARDTRVVSIKSSKNEGISVSTNKALARAKGRYVAFFDHDDLLVDRAIEIMVGEALRSGAKVLYCDEDKIDDSGCLSEASLKPDWNYRLLLAQNYVCHLLFVEHSVLKQVGPLRSEYNGAQDHDLILRLSEIVPAEKIQHVPELLYHWRKTPTSTSGDGKSKPYAVAAGIKAVADHLERTGHPATVSSPLGITCYEVNWKLQSAPKITVIIPYREQIAMTRECVRSLFSNTRYDDFDLILIDNWSTSDEALQFADEMARQPKVSVLRVEEAFNFSRLNNAAVAQTQADWLLFMNNDVLVSQPDWLVRMVGEAQSDERVAAVGNKLLYPNGLVQHAGVILGVGGIADHAFRGLAADDPGYVARAICAQDLSAVTAACMLCRRSAFDEVGGFDEVELRVAYNDVDLCLKLRQAGYRVIWTPHSVAEHRESLSRGNDFKPEHQLRFFHENHVMQSRWKDVLDRDPFYNPNFSRRVGIFRDLADLSE